MITVKVQGPHGLTTWTDERTKRIIELNGKGLSASLIAKDIGGVTRNAVIGKLNRLGLVKSRPQTSLPRVYRYRNEDRQPRNYFRPVKSPALPRAEIPPKRVEDVARVAFADLEPHHCRFPVGHTTEPDFGFCGLSKVEGSSYCAGHLHRCTSSVTVTGQMAAHDKATGDQTTAAVVEEILQPA